MAIADVIALERMDYIEKLHHWSGRSPWKVGDTTLRLPKPDREILRGHMQVERGHIRRMPKLIGRPCFGNPVAYLRHGGQRQFFNRTTGQWTLTRCMRCPVRDACEFVAEERLHASKEIEKARREFEHSGGRTAMWDKNASRHWIIPWRALIAALERQGPFESVNDHVVAAWCVEKEAEHRERDAARKRVERKKMQQEKAKRAEFTPELDAALNRERIFRRDRYRRACEHRRAPWSVRQAGVDAADFDTLVWMARERLRISDRSDTPYGIAKELHRLGVEETRSVNALRASVSKSVNRLDQLSRLSLDPSLDPVLPPLNWRELFDDLAAETTYEVEAT